MKVALVLTENWRAVKEPFEKQSDICIDDCVKGVPIALSYFAHEIFGRRAVLRLFD
jgi:hypothetical protein